VATSGVDCMLRHDPERFMQWILMCPTARVVRSVEAMQKSDMRYVSGQCNSWAQCSEINAHSVPCCHVLVRSQNMVQVCSDFTDFSASLCMICMHGGACHMGIARVSEVTQNSSGRWLGGKRLWANSLVEQSGNPSADMILRA
jgi:hypothetical protein